ncbi:hypothetical protein V1506DRAFT_523008 [Lipomyces tetrasporus]
MRRKLILTQVAKRRQHFCLIKPTQIKVREQSPVWWDKSELLFNTQDTSCLKLHKYRWMVFIGIAGPDRSARQPMLTGPATLAEDLLEQGLDIVTVGRGFQKNPGLVFAWADELGVTVQMPNQIRWAFAGRGKPGQRLQNRPQLDSYWTSLEHIME